MGCRCSDKFDIFFSPLFDRYPIAACHTHALWILKCRSFTAHFFSRFIVCNDLILSEFKSQNAMNTHKMCAYVFVLFIHLVRCGTEIFYSTAKPKLFVMVWNGSGGKNWYLLLFSTESLFINLSYYVSVFLLALLKERKNPSSFWNEACTDRTTYPQPITHTEQKYSISFNRNRWTTPYFSRKLRRNCLVIWIKFQNTFSICYKKKRKRERKVFFQCFLTKQRKKQSIQLLQSSNRITLSAYFFDKAKRFLLLHFFCCGFSITHR